MYSVHCTLYTVHSTVYSVHCVYSLQCTVQRTVMEYPVSVPGECGNLGIAKLHCTPKCAVYSVQCKLYTHIPVMFHCRVQSRCRAEMGEVCMDLVVDQIVQGTARPDMQFVTDARILSV